MESTTTWLLTLGVLSLVIVFDLTLAIIRRNKETTMTEAGIWTVIYVAAAIAFGILMPNWTTDPNAQKEFFAGWLTEYALSVDNIFVFVIILSRLQVEKTKQQLVLLLGIIIALVLRGGFIAAGSAIIEKFSGAFFIFGAFLIYTAIHQLFRSEETDEESESKLTRFLNKRIAYTETYDGMKLRTMVDGKKTFTPIIVVFITLALTDVMFAFDSIPAIFGITTDGFIVLTANIFALMGLRQLYFLLGSLIERLRYLEYGISAILAFIGFKLVSHAMHVNELPFINGGKHIDWAPEISTETSLIVIVVCLVVSAGASLFIKKKD